jgi:hypothetical protein
MNPSAFPIPAAEVAPSGGWIGLAACPGTRRLPARSESSDRDLAAPRTPIARARRARPGATPEQQAVHACRASLEAES